MAINVSSRDRDCPPITTIAIERRSSAPGPVPSANGAIPATSAQNQQRMNDRLTMPVLAIGGERSYGEHVADAMNVVAKNVQGVVIPGAGHWVAEEAPDQLLAALIPFLTAARRNDSTVVDTSRAVAAV